MLSSTARLRTLLGAVVLAGLLGLVTISAQAQVPDKSQNTAGKTSASQLDPIHPQQTLLDIHNMTTWVRNDGFFPWEDPTSHVNGTFPKGSAAGAVFTQGILWGGKVRDGGSRLIRVNGSTYNNGLDPGPVLGNDPDESGPIRPAPLGNLQDYHVWRVRPDWRTMDYTTSASQYFGVGPSEVTDAQRQQIRDQYEYDWNNWPAHLGAPYEDVNGDGDYDPDTDIPGRPGADQTIWLVANDLRQGTSERSYGSPAIGVEYQMTIWGYEFPSSAPLGNIHFAEAEIIYTGTQNTPDDARIDSMFVTQWVDPDVGSFGDDYAGSDTTLSLGYAYNSSNSDDVYDAIGSPPPAIGWDFLQGPVNTEGDTLGMTSYVYFAAGSDISDPDLSEYQGTLQWYNLMRGFKPRPAYPQDEPFINPITDRESKFTLPGDPVTGSGWIDGLQLPPGDRRIVQSSGPFQLELGDTARVVMGQIGAIGNSNISSVSLLKFHDQFAQFAYDQDFNLPSPPPMPKVTTAEMDEQVVLNWGTNREEVEATESTSSAGGFEFEGYRVYQLPGPNASLADGTRIATFDEANNVQTLVDNVFDEESGFVVEQPVQTLPNAGVQRHLNITQDRIRQRPLANGVQYTFAITAFSYLAQAEEGAPFRILESSPVTVTVTPQPPKPGTPSKPEYGSQVAVEQTAGGGDATITPTIIDPEQLVDADYTVTFDTTNGMSWNLLQDGEPVLTDQPYGDIQSRTTVNGLKVDVQNVTYSKPATILEHFAVEDSGGDLSLWGDATLFGAPAGYYSMFTGAPGPTVEEAQQDLEFRFTGNGGMEEASSEGGQLATYYERAAFGSTQPDTLDHKTIRMPFELWEVENDRQINFAVIGRNADGNSPWGNGAGDYYRMSARDYIVPIHTEYNESEVETNGTSPAAEEASWLLFFRQGGASVWETGDVYRVRFANPIVPGTDQFAFSTDALETGDQEDLEASVEEINVFPNPYVGFNQLEESRGNKFVTFTHLPDEATIRIFTLDGTPVRTIEHDRETQFEEWDLTNQDGIPVASGVYLAHVETPNGEKVLKLAVTQEEQILERY